MLNAARDELLGRAARITHPALRESFLAGIPEHAGILALARAWGLAPREP